MRRHGRQSGFTLVELIVAAVLTALICGSTVAMIRSSAAARRIASRQLDTQAEARAAVRAIAVALRNAHRGGRGNPWLEGADEWIGEMPADRVRLFTVSRRTVRPGRPESDVKECEFFLRQSDRDAPPALMRRMDPTRNPQPDDGGVIERVAQNVVALNLTYHDGTEWRDAWPKERKGWPMAINIEAAVIGSQVGAEPWTARRLVNFPSRTGRPRGVLQ